MKKYRGVFLKNEREIGLLREANRMVAMILDELGRQVRPGLPTMHFEEIVQNMCREFKVKPAFQGMYGFPYGLCSLCGKPMIRYPLETLEKMGVEKIVVVTAPDGDLVRQEVAPHESCIQREQLGTGHAVLSAKEKLGNFDGAVLVIFGDSPTAWEAL